MAGRSAKKKNVAVLGYGSQGRAIALNLRDSGWPVTVGLKTGSKTGAKAKKEGIKTVLSVAAAVKKADLLIFALPDHTHGTVFQRSIKKNLRRGQTLVFLHGLSVHFGLVKIPAGCDLVLLAPHAPGTAVREKYDAERDISAFYAVKRNATGKAKKTVFDLAEAIGLKKEKLVKTTFEAEAIGDLFGEQAVLCGGLIGLIKAGFDLLVARGIPSENAYLEVAYQLDLIVKLIKNHGITGMLERISVAARLGAIEAAPFLIDEKVKGNMDYLAQQIISGRFAKRLEQLTPSEIKALNRKAKGVTSLSFEKAAAKYSK